jgi:hypothetical protein
VSGHPDFAAAAQVVAGLVVTVSTTDIVFVAASMMALVAFDPELSDVGHFASMWV